MADAINHPSRQFCANFAFLELVAAAGVDVSSLSPQRRRLPIEGHPHQPAVVSVGRQHQAEFFEVWVPDANLRNCISRTSFEIVWKAGEGGFCLYPRGMNPLMVDGVQVTEAGSVLTSGAEVAFTYAATSRYGVFLLLRFILPENDPQHCQEFIPPPRKHPIRLSPEKVGFLESPAREVGSPTTIGQNKRWLLLCIFAEGLSNEDLALLPKTAREIILPEGGEPLKLGRQHQAQVFETVLANTPNYITLISRTHAELSVAADRGRLLLKNASPNPIFLDHNPVLQGASTCLTQGQILSFARLDGGVYVHFVKLQAVAASEAQNLAPLPTEAVVLSESDDGRNAVGRAQNRQDGQPHPTPRLVVPGSSEQIREQAQLRPSSVAPEAPVLYASQQPPTPLRELPQTEEHHARSLGHTAASEGARQLVQQRQIPSTPPQPLTHTHQHPQPAFQPQAQTLPQVETKSSSTRQQTAQETEPFETHVEDQAVVEVPWTAVGARLTPVTRTEITDAPVAASMNQVFEKRHDVEIPETYRSEQPSPAPLAELAVAPAVGKQASPPTAADQVAAQCGQSVSPCIIDQSVSASAPGSSPSSPHRSREPSPRSTGSPRVILQLCGEGVIPGVGPADCSVGPSPLPLKVGRRYQSDLLKRAVSKDYIQYVSRDHFEVRGSHNNFRLGALTDNPIWRIRPRTVPLELCKGDDVDLRPGDRIALGTGRNSIFATAEDALRTLNWHFRLLGEDAPEMRESQPDADRWSTQPLDGMPRTGTPPSPGGRGPQISDLASRAIGSDPLGFGAENLVQRSGRPAGSSDIFNDAVPTYFTAVPSFGGQRAALLSGDGTPSSEYLLSSTPGPPDVIGLESNVPMSFGVPQGLDGGLPPHLRQERPSELCTPMPRLVPTGGRAENPVEFESPNAPRFGSDSPLVPLGCHASSSLEDALEDEPRFKISGPLYGKGRRK